MKSYPMASQEFIDLEEYYGAHNYAPLDVVLTRGQGVWGYDAEGRRYLKCLSIYSTPTQGHCHSRLLQASRLTLTSRAFCNDCYQRSCNSYTRSPTMRWQLGLRPQQQP